MPAFGQQILICTTKKYIEISPINDPDFSPAFGVSGIIRDATKVEDDNSHFKISCNLAKYFIVSEPNGVELYKRSGRTKNFIEIG